MRCLPSTRSSGRGPSRPPRWHLHLADSGSVADRYAAGAISGLATVAAEFGMNHIGICAIPDAGAFIDASAEPVQPLLLKHCTSKANVTAFAQPAGARSNPPTTAAG